MATEQMASNYFPSTRQWPEIRQALVIIHVAGMVAYCQLGTITRRHKAKWDWQYIVLPLVFCFFPMLYICQMMMSVPLAVRNIIWRPYQGLKYYVSGILGDNSAEEWGPPLLLDAFKPAIQPLQKGPRSKGDWWRLIVALFALYQTSSTSMLYIRRWHMHGAEILMIDHRIGLMAIGACAASLAYIFLELTRFSWESNQGSKIKLKDWKQGGLHVYDDEVDLGGSINITHKTVYDTALAACLHLIQMRLADRHFPLFERSDSTTAAWLGLLPYALTAIFGIPIIGRSFWSSTLDGIWLPSSGKVFRFIILSVIIYIASAAIYSETIEIQHVIGAGSKTPLTANWA